MEMTAEWEQELDAIAGEIRDALSVEASTDHRLPCARALRSWVDTLIRLLVERQRLNDPEGATEVLDVFASLLKASADGRWRHRQEGAAESDGIYSRGRMEMIVKAMHAAVSTVTDTQPTESDEIRTHVITILASLFSNATHEAEIDVLLSILCLGLRGTPLENAISHANHTLPSDSMLEGTAWDACYVKFVLRFRSSSATPEDESKDLEVLRLLTGTPSNRVNDWIIETWETKWHLHRSARVGIPLFGPVENCVATIRKLFQGFSIGQDDVVFKNEAAVIMALRDANEHFGLVHGVDVTLIKGGHVHPSWKDSDRKIRLEDVDRALEEGYTIGVRSVQARSLPVFELCSKLQRELGQHVNANLYWTPPGQQGFDRHVDDHCVFAIQLKGRKRWVLYEPQELLPLLFDDTTPHLSTQAPRFHAEVILEEGDVLYVPRGVAHHADTKNIHQEAVHLTIGIEIDAANTNGRILEKLQDTELECSDNVKRRGLMAWHVTNPSAFCSHVTSFSAIESHGTLQKTLTSIQHELKNERQVFLAQRSVRASTMAMLHEIVQEVCYEQSPVGMDSDAIRPSKKQRQS